jgi:2-haloacid dehalogenase
MGEIKALAFDVFGTVVDWHGSITREVDALDFGVDGGDFARACLLRDAAPNGTPV